MFDNNDQTQGEIPTASPAGTNEDSEATQGSVDELPKQLPTTDPGSIFPPSQDPAAASDPFGTTVQPTSQDDSTNEDNPQGEASSLPTPQSKDDSPTTDSLAEIKKQALRELSPLVQHLDQSPEEKFKTTMMMIQASDNKDLVPAAYEAANSIKNNKVRAQALLDIINEINYFTQNNI